MQPSGQGRSEVGNFEFIKKLGEGGFGEVWLADDPQRGEKVAVKFLHLKHCDQSNIDVFKREFEILAELKQVHLARVFDFGFSSENEQYFLSTEFCPGQDLLEAIEGKPVSYFEEILVQILTALECIHSQGIIHFDIKPENVLVQDLDGHPNVKLVDFGVAVRMKALPQQFGGTLAFIAPEVLARSDKLDHRVDLYSLGMMCLFCLTHRLPFNANDLEATIKWHRTGTLGAGLWKECEAPGYLREITEKLLEKNPSDRFSNSRVVLNFLNLATGGRYRQEEEELQAQIPIEGPVVERREEIFRPLQNHLEQVLFASEPGPLSSVVFISGEAGIGKSRTLEEIRHVVQLKEIRFLQIDCDWNIPVWPKLEQWLNLPPLSGDSSDLAWQSHRRMDAILEAAKAAPICVLIDDFHKGDPNLRSVILELATHTQKLREAGQFIPLFVLVATEEDIPESRSLPRLSVEGVANYLKLVLGESIPTANLAEILFEYSGGLPLLMVEGLRFLAPHFFRGESLENLLQPDKIHLLYEDKIKQLKPAEEELLYVLALLFRSASEPELVKILEIESGEFLDMAAHCLKLGLMSGNPYGDPIYRVSSQALSLDLIGCMEPERRRQLHLRITRGLASLPGIPLQELAYHSAKAGEHEQAVNYYQQAGRALKKEGKISLACDCFIRAAELVAPGSEHWLRLNLKALRMLVLSGNFKDAEAYTEKLAPYPSWQRDETVGWFYFKTRRFQQARASYFEALKQIPDSKPTHRILVENALGNVDLQEGKVEDAVVRFRRALEWEEKIPPEDRRKVGNNNLGVSLSLIGQHEEAIQFFTERLEALPAEKVTERLPLLNGIGFSCLCASRFEETIHYLKEAVELAEESGARNALFSAMGNLLTALLKENRYAEGISVLQKMDYYQRRFGNRRDVAYNLLRQTSAYLNLGMSEFADGCIREGMSLSREISDGFLLGWFLLSRAYWEREFGSFAGSESFFQQAAAQAKIENIDELRAWAQYGLAEIYFDQKMFDKCRQFLEQVQTQGKDHEFDTRLNLLRVKVSTDSDPSSLFKQLEEDCLKNHFRELLWEVYQAWGQSCLKSHNREKAVELFEKGWKIIEGISSALPEEYQGRYRNQTARKRLYEDREAARAPQKTGFFAKLGLR